MRKLVAAAMHKLESSPIHTLSADEFRAYFEYRINNILSDKLALVGNELEYLLCETGPGNLRTDPEFLPLITKKRTFLHKRTDYPDLEALLNKKVNVEKYISEHSNATETQQLLFNIISPYLGHAQTASIDPYIITGEFEGIPVSCLIQNGKWLFPTTELFAFLQQCQAQKKFPVLIAKKISGILFPVFKNISVLGLNTYKIFLPETGQKLIKEITASEEDFPPIKYCNQFYFFTGHNGTETPQGTNPIDTFFETILKNNIGKYSEAFTQSKITIENNFLDTVSHFKKNNPNKNLVNNFRLRQSLIQALEK